MSDPVLTSIRAQRMALSLSEKGEVDKPRPTGWKRACGAIYREAVFIGGASGALLPALLMLLVAAYSATTGVALLAMLAIKLLA